MDSEIEGLVKEINRKNKINFIIRVLVSAILSIIIFLICYFFKNIFTVVLNNIFISIGVSILFNWSYDYIINK